MFDGVESMLSKEHLRDNIDILLSTGNEGIVRNDEDESQMTSESK